MPAPLSCENLATVLLEQPCPLLFLDTAAILDVLRVLFRQELKADIVDSAAALVEDVLNTPRKIWLVTTENVIRELKKNREPVIGELNTHIRNLNLAMSRLSSVTKIAVPEQRMETFDLLKTEIGQRMIGIMDRLVNSTSTFTGSTGCLERAKYRLDNEIAPAKAKQEFKDCEIFEEFLELLSLLRSQGFEPSAVFVSPNKSDYGPPPEGHPEIRSDLTAVNAKYAAHLSWARAMVRSDV